MQHATQRKTGIKVRNGKVCRKNRTALSNHYTQVRQPEPVIDRLRPGKGYKHFLTIDDVRRFIGILPDWNLLSRGLDAIVLDEGHHRRMGWHRPGLVAVCAWERQPQVEWGTGFVQEHQRVLHRLGVNCEQSEVEPEWTWCDFDENSVKGFQLMHVLLHELGHHHDRMTTKSRRRASRGERFAENYANRYADRLWGDYFREFRW